MEDEHNPFRAFQTVVTRAGGKGLVHSASPGKAEDDDEDEEPGKWWDEREMRMQDWLHRD